MDVEAQSDASVHRSDVLALSRTVRRVDPSRRDAERHSRLQLVRRLWLAVECQRDTLRRVRAEAEPVSAAALIAAVVPAIPTPPQVAHFTSGWIAIGIALILPWAWLVILDRLLRRTR